MFKYLRDVLKTKATYRHFVFSLCFIIFNQLTFVDQGGRTLKILELIAYVEFLSISIQ